MNPLISFCTTCMGRRTHLETNLRKNVEAASTYGNVEFILLDYNSPDKLEEWVREELRDLTSCGVLRYFRTSKPISFHHAHAKNMAHRLGTGDILVNLDADNFFQAGFAEEIAGIFMNDPCAVATFRNPPKGATGRIALSASRFIALGGYDEELKGWGFEDADLVMRANALGLKQYYFNIRHSGVISHSNRLRVHFTNFKARMHTNDQNKMRSRDNLRVGKIAANAGQTWGVEVADHNSREPSTREELPRRGE